MTTRSRLDLLRSLFLGCSPRRAGGPRRRARPRLEVLEDRMVPSTVQGTVFNDLNSDGVHDPGEPGIPDWFVYVDDGAIWMRTNADGTYALSGVSAGTHTVYARLRDSIYERTQPATGEQVVTFATDGETLTGVDFGNALTAQAPPMEFRVNTTTAGWQGFNSGYSRNFVAADDAGNFVVVWEGNGSGDSAGVFFQRFSAAGTPLGGETRINAAAAGTQSRPSIAMDPAGNFAVLWQSDTSVKARLFTSAGAPRTGEFSVANNSTAHDVAMADNGNFVVVYEAQKGYNRQTLHAQRYTAAGAVLGKAILISTTDYVGGNRARVAMDADGDFVVASYNSFQRVDRFGNKQGGSVPVPGGLPGVSMDVAGNFVIVFTSSPIAQAQLYYANGTPRGGLFDLGLTTAGAFGSPSVTMRAGGDFGVTLVTSNEYYHNVKFGHFDANGAPLTAPAVANVVEGPNTNASSVAMAAGTAVVVWRGPGPGDYEGVFGQRFTVGSPLRAAGGAKTGDTGGAGLTGAAARPLLREAIRRWQAAGLSPEQAQALRGIDLQIANLGGATLGLASGRTIWLDAAAAGWGWFVDPTPRDDSEFRRKGNQGEQGRMDLLSVLMHEVGHVLGLDHDEHGLMQETLAAGVREVPRTELADAFFALRAMPPAWLDLADRVVRRRA